MDETEKKILVRWHNKVYDEIQKLIGTWELWDAILADALVSLTDAIKSYLKDNEEKWAEKM